MATMHTITVTFRDYLGKTATITVRKGTSLNDAKQLATALAKYSRAAVVGYSHVESVAHDSDITGSQQLMVTEAGEHYDRVQQKCIFLYVDGDNGEKIRLSIPAPNDNVFDSDQEPLATVAEDIADAIGNSTTRESGNLIYNGGGLLSKLPRVKKSKRQGV